MTATGSQGWRFVFAPASVSAKTPSADFMTSEFDIHNRDHQPPRPFGAEAGPAFEYPDGLEAVPGRRRGRRRGYDEGTLNAAS
ncbi:MAG: hypothetical protein R3285_01870 [Kiloniellales bacterium]|nr:hypothetical protein [Kiloniellales bacterium]